MALTGIAHVAFLPPFEGFDEPAHLSYIQQIADTGHIPQLGIDKISTDIAEYSGPLPYPTRTPPFDDNGGITYKKFFATTQPALPASLARSYRPSGEGNDETQHPPLYYLVLAPLYLLVKDWSWQGLFLVLRSASWALAFAGFAIGCRATQRALAHQGIAPGLLLIVPLWPFLFPEFFPEMARLGNDSLCLLLMGISWKLLLDLLARQERRTTMLLGLTLGLGLLTKAFFLPITVGCGAILLYQAVEARNRGYATNAAVVLVVAVGLGGAWYLYKLVTVGSLVGSADLIAASRQGSLWLRLMTNFNLYAFLRGIAAVFASFVWAGTWSMARLPDFFSLPGVVLFLLPIFDWMRRLRRASPAEIAPFFLGGLMFAGMVYYLLTQMTRVPPGPGASGWYFHILSGPLSLALVAGWRRPRILMALSFYAILFNVVCWLSQLSLFSGCGYLAGSYRYLQFDFGDCFIEPARLRVLGEPLLGATAICAAVLAGARALKIWLGERRSVIAVSA